MMSINERCGNLQIKINKLSNESNEEESTLFTIHEVTPIITKAIEVLKETDYSVLARVMDKNDTYIEEKINLREILYAEYLERKVFLYTTEKTYMITQSFSAFMDVTPMFFIQISKNTAVNIYFVFSFRYQVNGNLVIRLNSEEELIVSRRYVKVIKETMKKLSQ